MVQLGPNEAPPLSSSQAKENIEASACIVNVSLTLPIKLHLIHVKLSQILFGEYEPTISTPFWKTFLGEKLNYLRH
jgi:hypothetical protein